MNPLDLPCPFCSGDDPNERWNCWHCFGDATVRGCMESEKASFEADQIDRALMRQGLEMAFTSFLHDSRNNYSLSPAWKVFYLFKLLVCYVMELETQTSHGSYPDQVECATPHYHRDGYGWNCLTLYVGHGVFRNWFCTLTSDGDSFM